MTATPTITLGFCWPLGDWKPTDHLSTIRSSGFDGVELWPRFIEGFDAEEWSDLLNAAGLDCLQLCPYFNFMGGPETVSESARMFREYLGWARTLSCARLRVFTGPPWGEGVVGGGEATAAQWQAAIVSLQDYCDEAGPGIELCLECHTGSLMEDSPLALRLIHAVERPNLTVNLQLPLKNEEWETSVRELGPYTTHIHIHNWPHRPGEERMTFLDAGVFDWLPVVRELHGPMRRPLCLSVEHPDHLGHDDPWESARRDGAYLQRLRTRVAAE